MKVDNVEVYPNGESISLSAVYSEDKTSENYSYSVATPSAQLKMFIANPSAFGAFELGGEYIVDFSPAS